MPPKAGGAGTLGNGSSVGSSHELMQYLANAMNAWRQTGGGVLVLMLQVHPSERRGGSSWTTTQRGLQLELARRLGSVASVDDMARLFDGIGIQ